MLVIMMMEVYNAKAVMKHVKLVTEAMPINAKTVKLIIIENFQIRLLVYASKDIMIIHNFNAINAIIHGFLQTLKLYNY